MELQPEIALVLLPGMDGSGRLFGGLLRALPGAYSTIVVGYPNETVITKDALVEYVERFLPVDEPFVLIAESFSGPIALRVAARARTDLRGVVLVSSFIRSPVRSMGSTLSVVAPLLFTLPLPNWVIRRWLAGQEASADLVREVRDSIRSVRPGVLSARLRQLLSEDVSDEAARCRVPLLYIGGTRDRLVTRRSEDALRAVRSDLKTSFIEAPHLVLQARPNEAARCILEFIAQRCR
jgi:pimeloyl-ACP methyl ester carboxylesterase